MESKSGEITFNQISRMIRYILTLFIALSIVLLIRNTLIVNINIQEIQSQVIFNNIFYSKKCFSYQDPELNRIVPGTIDLNKFTEDTINNCLYFGEPNNMAAALVTLVSIKDGTETDLYYNKEGYEILEPRTSFDGTGAAKSFSHTKYVFIKSEDSISPGVLYIKLILPEQ
ncbi:MAG: hypothetical protein MAG795_01010 [Candidatus Woesearchaeota archaeon]|nr:hypothetical protein [Candidatus Woesearchaeota archaeon]